MWLLIDDNRDLNCDAIARNPRAARKLLVIGGWDCLCIDHDLGAEESGYDILEWGLQNNFIPNSVQFVSSNPVGKQNMANLLKDYNYVTIDSINFNKI